MSDPTTQRDLLLHRMAEARARPAEPVKIQLREAPVCGPHRLPAGFVCLNAGKGCCFHFLEREVLAASRRGKAWRRREQHLARQPGLLPR